jgi:rare lipoprotein A
VLAVVAVLVAGAAAVWATTGGWPGTRTADSTTDSTTTAGPTGASPTPTPSGDPRGDAERATRSELRPAEPPATRASPPSASPGRGSAPPPGVATKGTCGASYYDTGQRTANGERFNPDGITAAHRTLPFNTRVRVTNRANGKAVVVRINDRGPFAGGRCLDLSRGAFAAISSLSAGVLTVDYEVLA